VNIGIIPSKDVAEIIIKGMADDLVSEWVCEKFAGSVEIRPKIKFK
jgi:hypothetical protein